MTPAEGAVIDAAVAWRRTLSEYRVLVSDTVQAMDPEREMAGAAAARHAVSTAALSAATEALAHERAEAAPAD